MKCQYLTDRVFAQCQFLQVLNAVSGNKSERAWISTLAADGLVLAPVGPVLLDADAAPLVDLSLQCNVGSELIQDADFGHLSCTCKKKRGKGKLSFRLLNKRPRNVSWTKYLETFQPLFADPLIAIKFWCRISNLCNSIGTIVQWLQIQC